jgi:hypothetical protein
MSYWSIAVDSLAATLDLHRADQAFIQNLPAEMDTERLRTIRPTMYWRIQSVLESTGGAKTYRSAWEFFRIQDENYRTASPYYWSREMTEAMIQSSHSVPVTVPMSLSWFPTGAFYWFLEHTARTPSVRPSTWDPVLREGGWQDLRIDAIVGVPIRSKSGTTGLYLELLTSGIAPAGDALVPFFCGFWREGKTIDEFVHDAVMNCTAFVQAVQNGGATDDEVKQFVRVRSANAYLAARELMAGGLWLNQRIMVTADAVVERHVRKRAAKTLGRNVDQVRVVHLRRTERLSKAGVREVPESKPESVDANGHRDWAYQWAVRGHWRHQYYRSLDTHQVIWIDPYVKGPEDKPLKPSKTVFAVIR